MKIYILMPTYNDSSTIVYSLDSILSQNYKNYEIIIVDDGSTDDTKKVINNYKKKYDKDNKIKYIYQENKDQLNALKTACNHIKEKKSLVYILHSDDLLDNPDVFKKAINYMKNNNYDAIISNVDTIDGNGNLSIKNILCHYNYYGSGEIFILILVFLEQIFFLIKCIIII